MVVNAKSDQTMTNESNRKFLLQPDTLAVGMKANLDQPLTNLSDSRGMIRKKDLAAALNVSARTIDNWVRKKRIPVHRFSSRLLRYDLRKVQIALDKYEVIEAGRKLS
jgi:DNA-binding transcriptional regulator YiaG